MTRVGLVLGWTFGSIWTILAVLLLIRGHSALALPMLLLAALHLPVAPLRPPVRATILISVFGLVAYVAIWFAGMMMQDSIYRSERGRARVEAIYEEKLEAWPVPYERVYVPTGYGTVHVIASGPVDAPAVVLLHAASMGAWSWIYNVEPLVVSGHRVYAVDLIGEAGFSELESLTRPVLEDDDIARLYTKIFDELGITTASLVGASAGGHQALRIALLIPDRVERVALCGPMGISDPTASIVKMSLGMLFPVAPADPIIGRWALGNDPFIATEAMPWFRAVLRNVMGRLTPPRQLTEEELAGIRVPVLLILADRDNLVGPAPAATERAQGIADVEIHTYASGHLINMERYNEVNALLVPFLAQDR